MKNFAWDVIYRKVNEILRFYLRHLKLANEVLWLRYANVTVKLHRTSGQL